MSWRIVISDFDAFPFTPPHQYRSQSESVRGEADLGEVGEVGRDGLIQRDQAPSLASAFSPPNAGARQTWPSWSKAIVVVNNLLKLAYPPRHQHSPTPARERTHHIVDGIIQHLDPFRVREVSPIAIRVEERIPGGVM
jgi:hypothetical protein